MPPPTPTPHPSFLSLQARGPHYSLCSYKMEKKEFSIIDSFNIELDCPYFSYRASSGLWAFFLPLLRSLLDLPSVSHSAAGLLTGCGIFVLVIDTGGTDGFTLGSWSRSCGLFRRKFANVCALLDSIPSKRSDTCSRLL